jgi:hypothetical protein
MCILCKDYIQVNIVTEEAARQVKLTEGFHFTTLMVFIVGQRGW